jgi:hypothetical protein
LNPFPVPIGDIEIALVVGIRKDRPAKHIVFVSLGNPDRKLLSKYDSLSLSIRRARRLRIRNHLNCALLIESEPGRRIGKEKVEE